MDATLPRHTAHSKAKVQEAALNERERADTHSKIIGYLLWIFGFTGSHRFYFGRPVSGTIWFFTLGLLGIGWVIDVFLIPWVEGTAQGRFLAGAGCENVPWVLFAFLGIFCSPRLYLG